MLAKVLDLKVIPRSHRLTGLFGYNRLKQPSDLHQITLELLQKAQIQLKHLQPNTIKKVDTLSDMLCSVLDACELLRNVHPDQEWVDQANQSYSILHDYLNQLNTNQDIYNALLKAKPSNQQERMVADLLLSDFEKSGIHMPQEKRQAFVNINNEIQELGQTVLQQSVPAVEYCEFKPHELDGLPQQMIKSLTRNNTAIVPMYLGHLVLKHCRRSETRQKVYLAMNSANEQQLSDLEQLLKKRAQLGRLLGKRSFAEHYLVDKMVKTPETVVKFLQDLSLENRPKADQEINQLLRLKQLQGQQGKIEHWDRIFYSQFLNPSQSLEPLSDYFTVGSVFEGLSNLFRSLYGVYLEPETTELGEVWHEDVQKLAVIDEREGKIGTIYCDLYERPDNTPKFDNPAHFTVRCSRKIENDEPLLENPSSTKINGSKYQLPIVVLVTHFPRPIKHPTHLHLSDIDTIFHEMGHAMHSCLAKTDYQHIAGTRVKMDFVEVPSIFMELLASQPQVLSFGRHHKTGAPVSFDLLRQHRERSNLQEAYETQHQIQMSLLDQLYHSELANDPSFNSTLTLRNLENQTSPIPFADGTHWQVQFSHLCSYGCSYYSYLWSRKWASRIFDHTFASNDWRQAGEDLRRELLQWGGGRDPIVGLKNLGLNTDI
ncbi:hypothetical protein EDD86DRAFT_188665 [Gorgonomyces haynaldii]|nr:hypothetical protein EDD86DRAFT_188665 [Gorgonomyces haynaldii]